MSDATCSLPDCDKPVYQTRPMCASHYMKNWRYGDPYFKQTIKHVDLTGQRFGELVALERIRGRWRCRCDCGAESTVRVGDLNRGSIKSCGNEALHWRTDQPNYFVIHKWLKIDRGPASDYPCVDCGNAATQWSYDNADPDELAEPIVTGGRPVRYSAHLTHYEPRCTSCHKQFDMDDRARRGEPILVRRGGRQTGPHGPLPGRGQAIASPNVG